MIKLSPLLESFFTDRLQRERQVSIHTIHSYRDTFCLLLQFATKELKKGPSEVTIEDLTSKFISNFLDHLEKIRNNGARTRNTRLAAIHSFFNFISYKVPQRSQQISQVLAIPQKRFSRKLVTFLNEEEIEALLNASNQSMWIGRRDYLLMLILIQTGMRVSELTSLQVRNIFFENGGHVHCMGKGRKERVIPLTKKTIMALKAWIKDEQLLPVDSLFMGQKGGKLSRDAVERLVKKNWKLANKTFPRLSKKKISPHTLRHACAMQLLRAGVDTSLIALYLGHESVESTQIFLHSDLRIKEKAIQKVNPTTSKLKRYKPSDSLLAFLEAI